MFMLTKAKRLIGWRKNSNKVKGPVDVIRERKREKIQSLDNVIMLFFFLYPLLLLFLLLLLLFILYTENCFVFLYSITMAAHVTTVHNGKDVM